MNIKRFSDLQIQAIKDEKDIIKLWAQGRVSAGRLSKNQLDIIRKFITKDINWNILTGSS